jgi:hypothetical protein
MEAMLKVGIRIIGTVVCALALLAGSVAIAAEPTPSPVSKDALAMVTPSDGATDTAPTDRVVAQAEQPPTQPEEAKVEEEAAAPDNKWWNLTFSYELSHNLARERPTLGNAFAVDPGFVLPGKVNLGLHLGFWVSTEYPSDVVGGRDVTVNTVDMDPISLNVSRAFVIDETYTNFTITPSLLQLFPETSRFEFQVKEWYYAIKPGVRFSVGKWGLSLAYSLGVQKNFHGDAYYWINNESTGTPQPTPLNSWTFSQNGSLRYTVWRLNMGVGVNWSRSWRYNYSAQEIPSNSLAYSADIGVDVYEGLSMTLGITTAGPERRYGGFKNDYTLPLDPAFTTAFLSIAYSI